MYSTTGAEARVTAETETAYSHLAVMRYAPPLMQVLSTRLLAITDHSNCLECHQPALTTLSQLQPPAAKQLDDRN